MDEPLYQTLDAKLRVQMRGELIQTYITELTQLPYLCNP